MKYRPLPQQVLMTRHILRTPECALFVDMGLGKDQPLDEPTPTPNGWVPFGSLKVGDYVFNDRGEPVPVLAVFPQGMKDVYRVDFSDGTFTHCGLEHLWDVRKRAMRKPGFVTKPLSEIAADLHEPNGRPKWWIPRQLGAQYNRQWTFYRNPYFIGYVLGNGCVTDGQKSLQVTVGEKDKKLIQYFPEPMSQRDAQGCVQVAFPKTMLKEFWDMGVRGYSHEKRIPRCMLVCDMEGRLNLLQGLMDADGSCGKNRTVFHSTSEGLATDVKQLVESLGGFATVRKYKREGKPTEFQVRIQMSLCPFRGYKKKEWAPIPKGRRGRRSIVRVTKVGVEPTMCISVPGGRYLTNHHIVTHNTAAVLHAIATLIADCDVKGVLIVAPLRVALLTWPMEVAKWDEFRWLRVADLRTNLGKMAWEHSSAHIYIINYDQLQSFCTQIWGLNRTKELPVDMVVWDELSKAKSHQSKRIRAFLPFRHNFKRSVGLTGTPTPNSYLDLQPQIRLLDGGKRLGANFHEYQRRYFESDYMGYTWTTKPHSKRVIREKIADMVLTLRAEEYLNVPATTVHDVEVHFPPALMQQYKQFQRDLLTQIEDKEIVALTMASLVNKLLQFTSGAIYDANRAVADLHDLKMQALKKILAKLDGPALIAFHYKHERERLLRDIPGAVEFADEHLDAWNRRDIPVMIGHPASIGHGLNLQKGGRDVIWFSLTYSRELYDQYNARLVRTGQKDETNVWRLIVPRTVDDAVAEALRVKGDSQSQLKQALANVQILDRDANVNATISQSRRNAQRAGSPQT